MMSISVIIPVYNAEKYLKSCLESVLSQTLPNIEIICIDDCSTDGSLAILEEYQQNNKNLLVFRQPQNMGAGMARNVGLQEASGEFVSFMDADDLYYHKDALKKLYDQAKKQQAVICGGGVQFFSGDGKKSQRDSSQYCFTEDGWIEYKNYQQHYYYQRFIFNTQLLRKNGITFPDYLRFQDPPFFVRAMGAAVRFYAIRSIIYLYREDAGHVNWTDRKINDLLSGTLDVLELCKANQYYQLMGTLLKNHYEGKYLQGVLWRALIHGNDRVVDFYRKLHDYYIILSDNCEIKIKTDDIDAIAAWNGQREIRFHHREIHYADETKQDGIDVSVIVPIYNVGSVVQETIDSILSQTLFSIEVICINDGSVDDSPRILDAYRKKDNRVKVVHQVNQGLSAARNEGLRHASGKYVAFCDGDDLLAPRTLETLVRQADAQRLDIVYFGAETFFDDNMQEQYPNITSYVRQGEYPEVANGQDMFVLLNQNHSYYTSACIQLFRTDFLRTENIAFFEGILHEDNLFTVQAAALAQRTGVCKELFYRRRVRAGSIMTTAVSYKNILGLYLTVLEYMKIFDNESFDVRFLDALGELCGRIICNNVSIKWQMLSESQKTLFLAALNKEERNAFQYIIKPLFASCTIKPLSVPLDNQADSVDEKISFLRVIVRKADTLLRLMEEGGIKHVRKALLEKRQILSAMKQKEKRRAHEGKIE